jgi:hypothetical protein
VGSIVGWDKGAEWFKGAARMERGSVFYHPEKLKQKTPCMQNVQRKGKFVCLFGISVLPERSGWLLVAR